METLVKLMPLSSDLWIYIAIDLVIALLLLQILRWVQGKVASVSVTKEISERDNFAYGIGSAGGMMALCLVLSAVVGRHSGQDYLEAAQGMLLFGAFSIGLVRFGRYVHDKIVLNRIDTQDMLREKNTGVALVDAASAIASAIIIRSMIMWTQGSDSNAFIAIISGFSVVLCVLVLLTRFYEVRFARSNQSDSFQGALKRGQMAVAMDHAGNILGTAIIVTIAADILEYSPEAYVSNVTGWLFVSIGLSIVHLVLVEMGKYVLFIGIDVNKEIDQQHNIGVSSVGFALNLGIAILAAGFFTRL